MRRAVARRMREVEKMEDGILPATALGVWLQESLLTLEVEQDRGRPQAWKTVVSGYCQRLSCRKGILFRLIHKPAKS